MTPINGFEMAWQRVEAALPEGWRMAGVIQRGKSSERWQAIAMRAGGDTVGLGTLTGDVEHIEGDTAPTPAAALDALFGRLDADAADDAAAERATSGRWK